ncbi:MAG: ABC transporter ATP-binding protein [Ardenticatenaceae bacterium]|nr:ABC transporter ATP-binding protein [Ardenticatenaceae bacterium]MCB9446198.1 ABC transporter ATP-binding protein [Ardenticatenaceae bacterium]
MTALLEVKELQTEFYTREGVVQAVNGISYALAEGEILSIVGESGSGKSVSVLSLMGLVRQPPGRVRGEAWFNGRNLLQLSAAESRKIRGKEIAMIFQDPMTSLNPVLTIGEQVGEALKQHLGMDEAQARKRTTELLELVGIPMAADRLDQYPHQFSGGMRQRVMIAMGLACNPRLLIADEPTTALDVTIQAQIVALVKRLQAEIGMAVIWITHDLGVVAGLAEKVIVMYAGSIAEMAPVDDLYEAPRHPYTLGLLGSLPRLDAETHEELASIDGMPPDLTQMPPGCPFAPRCPYVIDKCRAEKPILKPVGPDHFAACWVDIS